MVFNLKSKNNKEYFEEILYDIKKYFNFFCTKFIENNVKKYIFEDNIFEKDKIIKKIKKNLFKETFLKERDFKVFCPVCKNTILLYSDCLFSIFYSNYYVYSVAVLIDHYKLKHFNNQENTECDYNYIENKIKRQLIEEFFNTSEIDNNEKIKYISAFKVLENNDEQTNNLINDFLNVLENNIEKNNEN